LWLKEVLPTCLKSQRKVHLPRWLKAVIKLLHSTPLERGTFHPSEITAESLYLNLTFNTTERLLF
jgi:hypothetical protein